MEEIIYKKAKIIEPVEIPNDSRDALRFFLKNYTENYGGDQYVFVEKQNDTTVFYIINYKTIMAFNVLKETDTLPYLFGIIKYVLLNLDNTYFDRYGEFFKSLREKLKEMYNKDALNSGSIDLDNTAETVIKQFGEDILTKNLIGEKLKDFNYKEEKYLIFSPIGYPKQVDRMSPRWSQSVISGVLS